MHKTEKIVFTFVLLFFVNWVCHAMIFYSNGDSSFNTAAPTGSLENSGWEYQGYWNGPGIGSQYIGTPIARHYFITAKHTGGTTNWTFVFLGDSYTPIAQYEDALSDLEIWKVDSALPIYAPLYTNSNEAGKDCTVFGRGKMRGVEILKGATLKGWKWGLLDNVLRWGENEVEQTSGGFLYCTFDAGAGTNECHLADKDSGGAVFVNDGGTYCLAGIHYSVDGYHNTTNTGTGFFGAIFDEGGLYTGPSSTGPWSLEPDTGPDKPTGFYSTRISDRISWITNVIGDEWDRDNDYMPDVWESQYSGHVTGLTASADGDGDGLNNLQEFIADYNPTNANAPWFVQSVQGSNKIAMTFSSSTNRLYDIYYTTNSLLSLPINWQAFYSNGLSATDAWMTLIFSNSAWNRGYQRVGVSLP